LEYKKRHPLKRAFWASRDLGPLKKTVGVGSISEENNNKGRGSNMDRPVCATQEEEDTKKGNTDEL